VDIEPDVLPLGLPVTVQADVGKPLKATLPVCVAQVGCVMVPIVGADGDVFTVAVTANLALLSHPLTV
jgi:hypothetical protein